MLPLHDLFQVVMGGKVDETEHFMELTVIIDPDMDSMLMKVCYVFI